MTSREQLQLIHAAVRQVGLSDPQYRVLLDNVAGVSSSKQLTNSSFEDVMAVLEDMGFRDHRGETRWRDLVARRGTHVSERMVRKIHALSAESGPRYPLDALCWRHAVHSTNRAATISSRPTEAHNLHRSPQGNHCQGRRP